MRFRLRTLLILLAVGPPVLAGGYFVWGWMMAEPPRWRTEEDYPRFIPPSPEFKLSRP